jgi:hypothetical protein
MRSALVIAGMLAARGALAQQSAPQATPQTAPHVATRATAVRTAPASESAPTPAVGQLAKGATVEVIARDRQWVRVRLEGWVREADLAVADSSFRALSAADIRSDPEGSRGKLVRWNVQAVALQTSDPLRTGLQPGEQYLLALGPGVEKTLVYLAVPESLLATARSLPPLADVTVTARVRSGRSEPAGVPILDLQSLTRRQ